MNGVLVQCTSACIHTHTHVHVQYIHGHVHVCDSHTCTCRQMEFVVCERAHFISLCSQAGSGMELVAGEVEMQGYRMAVLQHWALNRARYMYMYIYVGLCQGRAHVQACFPSPVYSWYPR